MHAVVTHVTINDIDAATEALTSQVVPRVKESPGFVAGYWVRVADNKGVSVIAFESEDGARQAAQQIQPPGDFVTFDSVEVGEVAASA
jgi:hypothetical protein